MLKTSPTPDLSELEEFSALPPALALERVVPVLERLVEDPAFRSSEILPHLDRADRAREWYVAGSHNGESRSYSLQIFVWPRVSRPRSTTIPLGEHCAALSGP